VSESETLSSACLVSVGEMSCVRLITSISNTLS
jgi:hypothetical protein